MAMGITSALKLQEGSIRELAMLPQDLLMQMAQTGRIAPTLLPVVLNEKAEMAKQAANAQVLAKSAQGKPPSIIEQDMATNAQAEQAEEETPDTGLAALPVSDKVFSAAGGGIVAFDDGGEVKHYANEGMVTTSPFGRDILSWTEAQEESVKRRTPSMAGAYKNALAGAKTEGADYEERQRLEDIVRNKYGPMGGMFGYFKGQSDEERTQAKNILNNLSSMPIADLRNLAQSVDIQQVAKMPRRTPGIGFAGSDVEAQPGGFYGGQMPSTTPAAGTAPTGIATLAPPKEKPISLGSERNALIKATNEEIAEYTKNLTKPTVEATIAEMQRFDTAMGVDPNYYKKQAAELAKEKEGLKLDRSEAANMRLLEAGLAIMGGESPYALTNIGKGASKAMAGFAEDIKDIQKRSKEFDKAQRELEAAKQTAARSDSARAQERYARAQDKSDTAAVNIAKAKTGLAERLATVGIQERQLNKPGAELQLVQEFAKSRGIPLHQAYKEMYVARQEPKTEAQLRKDYADNYVLLKRDYPTADDYVRSQMGGTSGLPPGVTRQGIR